MNTNFLRYAVLLAPAVLALSACGSDDPDNVDPDTSGDVTDTDSGDAGTDVDDAADGSGDAADAGDIGDTTADAADVETDTTVDEQIRIEGMTASATIRLDSYGVPHITAETDADGAAVLGYLHARDRFAQMDLRRRVTTGRLPELVGEFALDNARSNRTLFVNRDGRFVEEAALEAASPETLALLEAYSAGVNAWLAEVADGRATLPDEYGYPIVDATVIPPWTPQDSIASVLALVNQLTNDSGNDLAMGRAWEAVGAEQAFSLYGYFQLSSAVTMEDYIGPASGDAKGLSAPPSLDALNTLRTRARGALQQAAASMARVGSSGSEEIARGSNNWVVAPSQTAAGNTLFSNDPHLGMSNPSVWYLAHIDTKNSGTGSYNTAGLTLAGLPWVVIGQNENIAWGGTVAYYDLSDVYIETLTEDGEGVVFNGVDVPFTEVPVTYNPTDGEPVSETILVVPHHGPVISIDREAGVATTLRWTGHDTSTDVNFLTELNRASNVTEAQEALSLVTTIGQNWVVADNSGNIGWFPYNTVPVRSWASIESGLMPFLPLPGDGSAEWEGFFALEDLPQLVNPGAGFISTANNDMTGALADGDPSNDGYAPLQSYPDQGYRQERIQQLLRETSEHTPETMAAIVGDTKLLWAEDILDSWLLAVADRDDLTDAGALVVAALDGWDYTCPTGLATADVEGAYDTDAARSAASIACSAFSVAFYRARILVFDDEYAEELWTRYPGTAGLLRLELRPETFGAEANYWDDVSTTEVVETRADILAAVFNAAGAWLSEELGADSNDWRWGRIHTLTLAADLFSAFGVMNFDNGPYANDGNAWTVDVASPIAPQSHNYAHGSGASARLQCEGLESGMDCTIQLPGGQRHYRDSANYDDLLELYLRNESVPFLFAADEVTAGTVETLTVEPTE